MKNHYDFKIGNNINDVHILPAFNHSLNNRFIISVALNSIIPSRKWLNIDQASKSIVITTNQVNLVSVNRVYFNARLITFDINQNNTSSYTTPDYNVDFAFSNSNCELLFTNSSYYTVINRLNVIILEFDDKENDIIILKFEQSDAIGLYSQQYPASNKKMKLIMQANFYSEDPIHIFISYTDFYHQYPSLYLNITISIYPFLVDPPLFENIPEIFNANR